MCGKVHKRHGRHSCHGQAKPRKPAGGGAVDGKRPHPDLPKPVVAAQTAETRDAFRLESVADRPMHLPVSDHVVAGEAKPLPRDLALSAEVQGHRVRYIAG